MRILSFSRVLPYVGVPHAGGEFVLKYYETLAELGHEVRVIVPNDERNTQVVHSAPSFASFYVVPQAEVSRVRRACDRIWNAFRSIYPPRAFVRALRADTYVQQSLAWAEAVDFQWTEYAALAHLLTVNKPTVAGAHDVLSQKFRREMTARRTPKSILKYLLVSLQERRLVRNIDLWFALSEKDSNLLTALGASSAQVVYPSLESPAMSTIPPRDPSGHILFVGALSRPENEDGIIWFLREVWPLISEQLMNKIVIAGASPSERLREVVGQSERAELTGYVEKLDDYYSAASAVICPIRSGAGVKFKTLTAMMWNRPVISTPIGAEGITPKGLHISELPTDFAKMVLRIASSSNKELEASLAEARADAFALASDAAMKASCRVMLSDLQKFSEREIT